jgi:hypothetical protein
LAKALEKEGFMKPTGPGFEAHHIQPTTWGGDDTFGNGIWLARTDHNRFSGWWNIFNFKIN